MPSRAWPSPRSGSPSWPRSPNPLPAGATIIDFELAGSVERTEEILATWRAERVIDDAKAIQVFDLFYPLIYSAALAGGCVAAAGAWTHRPAARAWQRWRSPARGSPSRPPAFDYVENLGLGISLWGDPASPWPQVALVAAVLKFTGIAVALLVALSGLAARQPSTRRV